MNKNSLKDHQHFRILAMDDAILSCMELCTLMTQCALMAFEGYL